MSLSTFRINQPPGTPYADYDRSRRDIDLYSVASEKVECEAQNASETTYLWEMESAPDGVSVTINNSTTNTCDFEIDTTGGYLIRLTVNAGLVTESITTLYFGVPLENLGVCLPALNETNHDNSQSPNDGARGSEDKINALLRQVDVLSGITIWPEDSVVFVERGATDLLSGTALLAAWTAVKALTPGGNALSATNRAMLIVPPGRYDISSNVFTIDADYIDILGYGECRRGEFDITKAILYPDTVIAGSGSSVMVLTTADHSISGLKIEQTTSNKHGITISSGAKGSFANIGITGPAYGSGGYCFNSTVDVYQTFVQCHVSGSFFGDNSYTKRGTWMWCTGSNRSWTGSFAGFASHCKAGTYSFGTVLSATAVDCGGELEFCEAGDYSFGFGPDGDANAITASGTFRGCKGGNDSFASSTTGDDLVDASGTFIDCNAGDWSFGGKGIFTGVARNCNAGDNSFGGSGVFSGVARNCESGDYSFGATHFTGEAYDCSAIGDSFGGPTNTSTGIMINCRCVGRHNPIHLGGGYMENCVLTKTGGLFALIAADSSSATPRIYGCTLVSFGSEPTIDAWAGTDNIKMAHCRLNNAIDGTITNLIGSGYNIVDSDITGP